MTTMEESVVTNQEPIDPRSYEISKIEQVFYDWWETRGQALVGDFSPQEAAFTAFKYGIYQQAKGTFDKVPTDDLDEFAVYWWGPDVDGENSLADAIESGRMSEFARAVLGHSPLTPAEIQLLKEGKCLRVGDYKIQLDGDFTTDAILRIAASLKGESPSV